MYDVGTCSVFIFVVKSTLMGDTTREALLLPGFYF
jgi:hypothetical protein